MAYGIPRKGPLERGTGGCSGGASSLPKEECRKGQRGRRAEVLVGGGGGEGGRYRGRKDGEWGGKGGGGLY